MAYEMTALRRETDDVTHNYEMVGKPPESVPVISNGDKDEYEVPSLPATSHLGVGAEEMCEAIPDRDQ